MIISRLKLHGKLLFIFILFTGGIDVAKEFVAKNGNTKEHDEFYKMIDISRENVWIKKKSTRKWIAQYANIQHGNK